MLLFREYYVPRQNPRKTGKQICDEIVPPIRERQSLFFCWGVIGSQLLPGPSHVTPTTCPFNTMGGVSSSTVDKDVAYSTMCEIFELFKKQKFCDITLEAGTGAQIVTVKAHKAVLCAASRYLKKRITKLGDDGRVLKVDCAPLALTELVNYLYCGGLDISSDTVLDLVRVGRLMNLQRLINHCQNYLIKTVDVRTCIATMDAFVDSRLEAQGACVFDVAVGVLAEKFVDVAKSDAFLGVVPEGLSKALASEELVVGQEAQVFDAVMRWVRHDATARRPQLPLLFSYVRLRFVGEAYFSASVLSDPLVRESAGCRPLLVDAMNHYGIKADLPIPHTEPSPVPSPANPAPSPPPPPSVVTPPSASSESSRQVAAASGCPVAGDASMWAAAVANMGEEAVATHAKAAQAAAAATAAPAPAASPEAEEVKPQKSKKKKSGRKAMKERARAGGCTGMMLIDSGSSSSSSDSDSEAGEEGDEGEQQQPPVDEDPAALEARARAGGCTGFAMAPAQEEAAPPPPSRAAQARAARLAATAAAKEALLVKAVTTPWELPRRCTRPLLHVVCAPTSRLGYLHKLDAEAGMWCTPDHLPSALRPSDLGDRPAVAADPRGADPAALSLIPEPGAQARGRGLLLYFTGGSSSEERDVPCSTAFSLDVRARCWSPLPSLLTPRQFCASAFVARHGSPAGGGGKLYVVGGRVPDRSSTVGGGTCLSSSGEVLDTESLTWTPLPDMKHARSGHTLTAVGGLLYAVGGIPETEPLSHANVVEVFNPAADNGAGAWSVLPSPLPGSPRFGSAAVGLGGALWITGGFTLGGTNQALVESEGGAGSEWRQAASPSVLAYDAATATWSGSGVGGGVETGSLEVVRGYHGCAAVAGRLMVMGGLTAEGCSSGACGAAKGETRVVEWFQPGEDSAWQSSFEDTEGEVSGEAWLMVGY